MFAWTGEKELLGLWKKWKLNQDEISDEMSNKKKRKFNHNEKSDEANTKKKKFNPSVYGKSVSSFKSFSSTIQEWQINVIEKQRGAREKELYQEMSNNLNETIGRLQEVINLSHQAIMEMKNVLTKTEPMDVDKDEEILKLETLPLDDEMTNIINFFKPRKIPQIDLKKCIYILLICFLLVVLPFVLYNHIYNYI